MMALKRMVKIKEVPRATDGLISTYMARKLFKEGKLPGIRLGNSMILIDLDGLERMFEVLSQDNLKEENQKKQEYGQLRKVY